MTTTPAKNDLSSVPAAACPRCGGWTSSGGMSQYAKSSTPVLGRTGCSCNGAKLCACEQPDDKNMTHSVFYCTTLFTLNPLDA